MCLLSQIRHTPRAHTRPAKGRTYLCPYKKRLTLCFYLSFSTGGPNDGSTYTVVPTGAVVTRANGGNIPDELVDKTSNEPGTLSMANTGSPNTGGSQFFVNTVHNDFLDHWRNDLSPSQHPVFGKVVSGMDVVMKIGKTKCDHNDNPVTPVMMKTITIA